jgi:hypothetical protein
LVWSGSQYQKVPEALELAILCHEGDEVTQDLELAYFWALMAQKTEERDNPKLKELMTFWKRAWMKTPEDPSWKTFRKCRKDGLINS